MVSWIVGHPDGIDRDLIVGFSASRQAGASTAREKRSAVPGPAPLGDRPVLPGDERAARRADRIVVIEDGAILEEGTHDALMVRRGAYFRLGQGWRGVEGAAPTLGGSDR